MKKYDLLHIKDNTDDLPEFDLINENLIDLSEEFTEPDPVIKLDDKVIFSRSDFVVIGGSAKTRKTFLTSAMIAGFLGADEALGFESPITKGICLLIDTEQSRPFVQRVARRIHRLCEWEIKNNSRLIVLVLRELSSPERVKALEQAMERFKPDLCVIDGCVDLLDDFNDIRQSNEVKQLLLRLTSQYNCGLLTVIHENKVGGALRGHLGSFMVQKAQTVLSVKSNGNHSTVSPAYCRGVPFEEFNFTINNEGLPELCTIEPKKPKTDKLTPLFSEILPTTVTLNYADLTAKIINKTGKVSRTAERHIKEALDLSIIVKNNSGMYYCPGTNLTDNNDELPF